jgi:hypothetical protein
MALPKLKVPLFDVTIPSTNKNAKFRPFLVKEEKILLIAQAGGTKKEIINALKQIINNCITLADGTSVNTDVLTTFDLEYLFIKIRAKSVDNMVKLKYLDHEDEKTYEFEVRLDDIEIIRDPDHKNKIKVDNDVGIILNYPTASTIMELEEKDVPEEETAFNVIVSCIDSVYDAENVYPASEETDEELQRFVESLSVSAFADIQKFFDTMPKLHYKIEYTNSMGTDRVIELSSLDDFFTLV